MKKLHTEKKNVTRLVFTLQFSKKVEFAQLLVPICLSPLMSVNDFKVLL